MNKIIKNSLYTGTGLALLAINNIVNAAGMNIAQQTINDGLKGSDADAGTVIQNWINIISGFLYIVAVIVILWAGFQILTAAGDEEKTKKGKTVIIQAVIGLLVIFIASSVVTWIIQFLFTQS